MSGRAARVWWTVGAAVLAVVLVAAALVRFVVAGLPPGTMLAGEEVGSVGEARTAARQLAASLDELPVVLVTDAGEHELTAGRLGASVDIDAVGAAAEEARGLDGWSDRYGGGGPVDLPFDVTVGQGEAAQVADLLTTPPVEGGVDITPTGVEVTDPVVGVTVTADAVHRAFSDAVEGLAGTPFAEWPEELRIDVAAETASPVVTQVSVDAVLAEIERITSTPIELQAQVTPEDAKTSDGSGPPHRETKTLTLGPTDLEQLFDVEVDRDALERERLQVVASDATPPAALTAFLEDAAVPPELSIRVDLHTPSPTRVPNAAALAGPGGPADMPAYGDVTTIRGDLVTTLVEPGVEPQVTPTIEAIVAAALAGVPTAEVQGTPVTDEDPALLGIRQPVSTWTTFYDPGQPRVTNIHRIAELVDGTLITPGGNYELNHAVGDRTESNGFVHAGAILEGEFITDVGGGVSQFATTLYNAVWFAGLDIITHTPHSYWFERYPAGREATIDYPGVNLEFDNDTPSWILIDTTVTNDSVTVTLWSTPWFTTQSTTGDRQPVEGGDFRIVTSRHAVAQDGFVDDDSFTTTYGVQPPH